MNYQGSVYGKNNLPPNPSVGDCYTVKPENDLWVFSNSGWVLLYSNLTDYDITAMDGTVAQEEEPDWRKDYQKWIDGGRK